MKRTYMAHTMNTTIRNHLCIWLLMFKGMRGLSSSSLHCISVSGSETKIPCMSTDVSRSRRFDCPLAQLWIVWHCRKGGRNDKQCSFLELTIILFSSFSAVLSLSSLSAIQAESRVLSSCISVSKLILTSAALNDGPCLPSLWNFWGSFSTFGSDACQCTLPVF